MPIGLGRATAIAAGYAHAAALVGNAHLPCITAQPQGLTTNATADVTLSVSAVGSEPLSYQWQKNGINLAAGTNATLLLSSVTTNHSGSYAVVVTNLYGSATSDAAVLTVTRLSQTVAFSLGASLTRLATNAPFSNPATASSGLTVAYSVSDAAVATVNAGGITSIAGVGQCQIFADQEGNEIYNPAARATQSLTINPAAVLIFLTNLAQVYDGNSKTVTAITLPDNVMISLGYNGATNPPVNATTYEVAAISADFRYTGSATNTLVIAKATPGTSIPPAASDIVYGQNLTSSTLTGSYTNLGGKTVPGTLVFLSSSIAPQAGSTNVMTVFTPTDLANYFSTTSPVAVSVQPKPLTLTANATNKIYGSTLTFSGNELTENGLIPSDSVTNVTLLSAGTTNTAIVGVYPLIVSAAKGVGLNNYDIRYVNSTLTISGRAASVVAEAKTKIYGAANPALTAVTNGALNGDVINVTLSTDATLYSGVGVSNIVVNLGSNPNYVVTPTNSTMTITPATLEVAANVKSKVYGTADPALTYVVGGFVNGDMNSVLTGTLARAPGETIGSYAIGIGTLSAGTNYTIAYTGTNLTINQAISTATLSVANTPVTYNGAGQTATVSITSSNTAGAVANILVGGQLSQTNAGTYAVTADYVPSDTNYIGTNIAVGNFVINQAISTATLSVANTPVTYSGSGQTATVSVTSSNTPGAVANILVGGQLNQTNAGSYAVTADYVPTDTNAAILVGLSAGTFTIEKVDATVSADAKSKLYGEANPALTATVTGTLGSDVIHYTLATDATQSSGVGVSNIVVNLESNVNYSVTTHNSTLTINPASGGISLTNLAQSFTGGALAPTVITVPSGLSNSVTYFLPLSLDTNCVYDGMTAAPTNIATYTVIAALQGNYTGRVTNTFVIGQADSTYTNTQTISGSTEITGEVAGPVVVAPNGSVTVSNGTFNAEVTVQDGGTLTVSNSVFNAPVVVQSGGELNTSGSTFSNTVSLQGSTVTADETTFAGPVTVEDGGVIGGSNSEFTAPVTVQDGGTLKGSGTTFRDLVAINDGGTHSPGNSPGVQTFTNGLTYASGSALDWELAANTTGGAGVNYDRVNVTGGNLVIGSNAVINLFFTNGLPSTVDWSDSFWSSNRVWTVIDAASAGSRSGVFELGTVGVDANGLALAAVRGGAYFTVVANGQNIVLSYTAKTEATVTLTNLSQTYDGAGKPVTAVTSPTNLNVVLTYSGTGAAPTNSGSYVVIATVADNNYQGSATNTLVIAKATATLTIMPTASPIIAGESLASSILKNGAATIPGTFNFTTPNTVPALGTSIESITFTPIDLANYNTITTTVSVMVYNPPAPAEIAKVSDGIICIKFIGLPSVLYEIQTATNLAGAWIPIATNTAGSDGSWLFTDSSATNIQQYYRSHSIQP